MNYSLLKILFGSSHLNDAHSWYSQLFDILVHFDKSWSDIMGSTQQYNFSVILYKLWQCSNEALIWILPIIWLKFYIQIYIALKSFLCLHLPVEKFNSISVIHWQPVSLTMFLAVIANRISQAFAINWQPVLHLKLRLLGTGGSGEGCILPQRWNMTFPGQESERSWIYKVMKLVQLSLLSPFSV